MIEAFFGHVKRYRHVKNRLAMLDCQHMAGGEATAIAGSCHLIDDGCMSITGPQEISMHGMRLPFGVDRASSRHQRLPEYLAAKQAAKAEVITDPTENVLLYLLELKQLQKLAQFCLPRHRDLLLLTAAGKNDLLRTAMQHCAATAALAQPSRQRWQGNKNGGKNALDSKT